MFEIRVDVIFLIILIIRVELTESGTRAQEHILLQPITLGISICRNLTISWNKQRPELEVAAKLKPIEVSYAAGNINSREAVTDIFVSYEY